ncbi:MAG: MaoC family dehydratase [Rhodospirillales bacterium]|nr:MaoC family dehydratase [Rhodospirillales bacterium]
MRYFEDFAAGDTFEFGNYLVTEEEILGFARKFDPQSIHLDWEAAKTSIFGGLIASGLHTLSILMRMTVDGLLNETAGLGSPGIDEARWLLPVRPGDVLSARFTVMDTIPSRSRPERGVLQSLAEVLNQKGEVVATQKGKVMVARRAKPV